MPRLKLHTLSNTYILLLPTLYKYYYDSHQFIHTNKRALTKIYIRANDAYILTYYLYDESISIHDTDLSQINNNKIAAPPQTSTSLPWATDRSDALRESALSPPPAKRSRSTERSAYTPDRVRSPSRGNGDMQESLLGQALEGGPTLSTKEVRIF